MFLCKEKVESSFHRLLFYSSKYYLLHYAIDIADPSSMQDACQVNFVINLAKRGVSVV